MVSKDRVPLPGNRTHEGGKAASDLGFRLQAGGKALRHRNFQLFFSGQLISLVGTWMQSVAQSWLVYRLTGSGLLLGSVGFVSQIPVFLFATTPSRLRRTTSLNKSTPRPSTYFPHRISDAPLLMLIALGFVQDAKNLICLGLHFLAM